MAKPIAYYDPDRQLARVVELTDVKPHPNADRLDLAIVDGWQVVVGRGTWKKGDKALFCEVGGLLPVSTPEFFDAARDNVKTFNEIEYAYIKSIRLRKEISQGYICPVPSKFKSKPAGTDLTRELGVLKYESNPTQAQTLGGEALGDRHEKSVLQKIINFIGGEPVSNLLPFPEDEVKRSTESRAQNMLNKLSTVSEADDGFEMSVKLDGNSMTVHFTENTELPSIDDDEEHKPRPVEETIEARLLSRDTEISLKPIEIGVVKAVRLYVAGVLNGIRRRFNGATKIYWPKFQTVLPVSNSHFTQMFNLLLADGLKKRVAKYWNKIDGSSISFQGEVIGPGVDAGSRSNYEGVGTLQFRVYRVFIDGEEVSPNICRDICKDMKLQTVPILDKDFKIRTLYELDEESGRVFLNIRKLLELAEGPRALAQGGQREGIVLKSNKTKITCKVISNAFLLKNGDD